MPSGRGINQEPFLAACILDLSLTGDKRFAKASVQTAMTGSARAVSPNGPIAIGRSGIFFHWAGANGVGVEIADSTQKFKVGGFICGGGQTCKQDAAAGSYFLKVGAPGFTQLIPISVTAAGASEITPPTGVISFHWAGANGVGVEIADSTQKFKVGGFICGGGQTCKQDAAAGSYFLKVGAPGFTQLIPISVTAAGASEITPPTGVISFHWAGANGVGVEIADSTQKFKVGGFICGGGQTCKQDAAAGSYFLKVGAPGFTQLIPISVTAAGASEGSATNGRDLLS